MEAEQIIAYLSPIERAVLSQMSEEKVAIESLANDSLDEVTVVRAIGLLKEKGLVGEKVVERKIANLGILGIHYVKKGLPERVLLTVLSKQQSVPIGEVKNVTSLNENESKIAVGTLKSKSMITIVEGRVKLIAVGDDIIRKFGEEKVLDLLPCDFDSLKGEEAETFRKLLKRKDIVEVSEEKKVTVSLTTLGASVLKVGLDDSLIEQVTSKLIRGQGWKGKKFRKYDVAAPTPRLFTGKRHFVEQATDYAKSIWLEMGFGEMQGDMALTGLYNFDALFTAQDHPVREEHDTFYVKGKSGKLPDKQYVDALKRAHEGGVDDSAGWKTTWDAEVSKKVVLRTHTTPLSIQKMREIAKNKEFPAKYFSLGKCFRNETVDWSHGFEFNQTEGIVVDENANFRQLLGYLKQFFSKMGYDKLRIRPAYFP
ncbi:MAG: phenylalanyl-tRNA synthetase alpha chain, partial [Patescibacteria group bacterium]